MAGRKAMHSFRAIQFVARAGAEGVRMIEIQRFVVTRIKKYKWGERDKFCKTCHLKAIREDKPLDPFDPNCGHKRPRRWRAYWGEYLNKILPRYCLLGDDKRWRINSLVTSKVIMPLRTEPISPWKGPPKPLFRLRGAKPSKSRKATSSGSPAPSGPSRTGDGLVA